MEQRLGWEQDAVALLLGRIGRRVLAGSLATGTVACASCVTGGEHSGPPARDKSESPAQAGESEANVDASPAPPLDAGAPAPLTTTPDAAPIEASAITCSGAQTYPLVAGGLRPAMPYDYVAVREVNDVRGGMLAVDEGDGGVDGWSRTDFKILSEHGTPCATATGNLCRTKVARHPSRFVATTCGQLCLERSVVTTRGDEVKRWVVPEDLLTLLGPIDSFDEALLLVSFAGYDVRCNDAVRTSVRDAADGYEVVATRMTQACSPVVITRFRIHVSRAGVLRVLEEQTLERLENACVGRKSDHVVVRETPIAGSPLGAFLARSAQLEAASVHAFTQLAHELTAHGAPRSLSARAHRAARDEVRHARVVSVLARRRGGVPRMPEVTVQPPRALLALATENAVEGCIRETFGAVVGAHQAARATDEVLRSAMEPIAADEARHASLAHAVHAWVMPRLSEPERAIVRAAQRRAISELAVACDIEAELAVRVAAGLPTAAEAAQLFAELADALWLPALAA